MGYMGNKGGEERKGNERGELEHPRLSSPPAAHPYIAMFELIHPFEFRLQDDALFVMIYLTLQELYCRPRDK